MGSILAVTQADVVEASVNLYMLTVTSHGNKQETALMDGSLAFGVQAAPHLRIDWADAGHGQSSRAGDTQEFGLSVVTCDSRIPSRTAVDLWAFVRCIYALMYKINFSSKFVNTGIRDGLSSLVVCNDKTSLPGASSLRSMWALQGD